MAITYTLKDNRQVEAKVTFIRVKPGSKREILGEIFDALKDTSWIMPSMPSFLQQSYTERAKRTLDKLEEIINESMAKPVADEIISDAAEYIVSVVAQDAVVKELNYGRIPLPEVFKQQKSQNPGFDFLAINDNDYLLFGEAKFLSNKNAYGSALKQIVDFIDSKNDIADLADLVVLVPRNVLDNVADGHKGYMAAFSSTDMATDKLVNNIISNDNYNEAKQYEELILIAVDMV